VTAVLRLVAAFGALGFAADRVLARLLPGPIGRQAGRRSWGAVLLLGALLLILLRSLVAAAPVVMATSVDIATVGRGGALEGPATISGVLADVYIVSFLDTNRDRVQQPDESGTAWIYFVGTVDDANGLTVSSSRPPEEVFAAGRRVSFSGLLVPGRGSGIPLLPGTELDPGAIPFPLSGWYLYEGHEPPQVVTAREAMIILGAPILLLALALALGYAPFRETRRVEPRAADPLPTKPARVRLNGMIQRGGRVERVLGAPAVARLVEDAFAQRSVLLVGIPSNETLGTIEPAQAVEEGDSFGIGGPKVAIRWKHDGRVLDIAFDSILDRDAFSSALRPPAVAA
jgi:hypothetical protein